MTTEPGISGGYIWKKDKDDPDDQNFTVGGKLLTSVYPKTMPAAQLNWLTAHLNAIESSAIASRSPTPPSATTPGGRGF